ncbi:hypothetical protein MNV49_007286 [Pseudohyphozyma bogoriensis]|nr:hypothetical protein MNV49_007286 [Pseudohyphozyma bogoriensis]
MNADTFNFLQPITRNLPEVVSKPLIALIGQGEAGYEKVSLAHSSADPSIEEQNVCGECYITLIYNTDLTAIECIKYSISKGLGLAIVAGGSIVKVPQILKIVGGKSARGLSLSSYILDTANLAITVAYNVRHNFPWSTYGENVFLLVQNVIITFLIIIFSPSTNRGTLLASFLAVFTTSAYLLSSEALPLSTLQLVAALHGSTLRFLGLHSLAGCLARVYTTSTETKDPVLWWGFFLGAVLNAVLAVQMAMYWNKGDVVDVEKQKVYVGERSGVSEKKALVAETVRPASPATTPKRYVRKLD